MTKPEPFPHHVLERLREQAKQNGQDDEAYLMSLLDEVDKKRHQRYTLNIPEATERLFQLAHDMMCIVSLEGHFLRINPALIRTLNYQLQDLYASPFTELLHLDDREQAISKIQQSLHSDGKSIALIARIRHKNNHYRLVSWMIYPDASRQLMYCVGRDITIENANEERLKRSARNNMLLSDVRQFINRAPDEYGLIEEFTYLLHNLGKYPLIWIAKYNEHQPTQLVVKACSHADQIPTENILNVDMKSSLKRTLTNGILSLLPDIRDAIPELTENLSQNVATMALPIFVSSHIDYILFIHHEDANQFTHFEKAMMMELVDDLAYGIQTARQNIERERMTQELRISETNLRTVLNTTNDIAAMAATGGSILLANEALSHMLQLPMEDIIGQDGNVLFEPYLGEQFWHKKGIEIIKANSAIQFPIVLRGKNYNVIMSPLKDENGWVNRFAIFAHDTSTIDQLAAQVLENKQLQLELDNERELVNLKQQFISMISHEFRTPMAIISATSQIVTRYWNKLESDDLLSRLKLIESQVKHMANMFDNAIAMEHAQDNLLSFHPVVSDVVQITAELLETLYVIDPTNERITLDLHSEIPKELDIDRRLYEHILINLLTNAIKYSQPPSDIRLELQYAEEQLLLVIEDYGIGIPQTDQAKIFEAYHRASNSDIAHGTDLGLVVVMQSVIAHGGKIDFKSEVGKGTTFNVTLPTNYRPNLNESEDS